MAQVGLRKFYHAPLKTDTDAGYTYESAPVILAGAIESKVAWDNKSAELYSDDQLNDSMKKIAKGTITLGVDDDDETIFAPILGQTAVGSGTITEYITNVNDNQPYYGFGQIKIKRKKGKYVYRAEFLPKVQFTPFVADGKTSGDSLEYTTPSVEGTILPVTNGDILKHKEFATEEAALTYLKGCFKVTA